MIFIILGSIVLYLSIGLLAGRLAATIFARRRIAEVGYLSSYRAENARNFGVLTVFFWPVVLLVGGTWLLCVGCWKTLATVVTPSVVKEHL
jgi:hypothetical protein